MPLTVMRRVHFCAGHRLLGHEGKCAALHGHNYTAEFQVTADKTDSVGRIIDFAELKLRLKGWIDEHWDHGFILWKQDEAAARAIRSCEPYKIFLLDSNPTVENMAKHLLEVVCPAQLGPLGVRAVRVILWETADSFAEAS